MFHKLHLISEKILRSFTVIYVSEDKEAYFYRLKKKMRGSKLSKNIDPHHGRGCKTNFFGTSDSISAEGYPRQIDKL